MPDAAIGPFDPVEMQRAMTEYFGLINHVDDRINSVLDRYFEYGNARRNEPILVIFTSDHGEMLGDHHLWRKSLPYEASAHVPMFVTGLNMDTQSGTSDALVGLEDAAATVLDAAGAEVPDAMAGVNEGKSLLPYLRDETATTRDRLFGQIDSGGFDNQFLIEGPLKYVRFTKTGEEQLFDVLSDPKELHDLSADAAKLEPMRAAMNAHRVTTNQAVSETLSPCEGQLPRVFSIH